jgi:hypothetical protein
MIIFIYFLFNKMNSFLKSYLFCFIFIIYINYTTGFDCTCFPIIKKLFQKTHNYNNYKKKDFTTRETTLRNRRYKLSKFQIDKTASDIVGPKKKNNFKNNTLTNDNIMPSNYN